MSVNFDRMRECLNRFEFDRLFVEELGWSHPASQQTVAMKVRDREFTRRQLAQLAGVAAFELGAPSGPIPDARIRAAIHKEIAALHHENLLIFVDAERTQSLWYWVKREGGKIFPRDHFYFRGQPGDLFLSKLKGIVFELGDFDASGDIPVVEVAKRLGQALDVERVTKKFYGEFQEQHLAFLELIQGIPDERERRWYASVLLNRLMFIYFLQRKGFIDKGDIDYLQNKLSQSKGKGRDLFYQGFLKLLFFEGFAKPEQHRSPAARQTLGSIKYLNGGLFLPHPIEQHHPKIDVPDRAFENLLSLFQRYSWNLDDTPGGQDNEINPDVLGYIFEKYINQKAFGAYYTRPEITEYLCERTVHRLILDAINGPEMSLPGPQARHYDTVADLLMDLDAGLCKRLLFEALPRLSLLDPACGSGAFLVAAMKTLINVYAAIIGKIKFLNNHELSAWLKKTEREHQSLSYFIKKRIITDNLYGVDLMEEATEIARLRLFLALVASAHSADQLEPLPNIDFNILAGNSLIGLMRVDDKDFDSRHSQGNLFFKSYSEVVKEKNRLIESYRHASIYIEDLTELRDRIQEQKREALETLDNILLDEFKHLEIKFEQAVWDAARNKEGKSKKRALTLKDLARLRPFHWGYEFDEILNKRGGFDAILTNPPWEIFKPNGKEFFEDYSELVSKKKMTIHDFEAEQADLLKDQDIRKAWLEYLSGYPHVSTFFRSAPQYRNQISVVNGKKAGTDINLYKLFTEQCFNLLRPGGQCGLVIPSGIYTDLGTKQLREMLFSESRITGLFGFENRKEIFEGVHRSFKFIVLTFEKGGNTEQFPAAFMRLDVDELERFPQQGAIDISVDLVRRLSPDSLSLMEFKNEMDVQIAEKMGRFPMLGESFDEVWNLQLVQEIHMTNDSHLFKTTPGKNRAPLIQGNMFHQFEVDFAPPKYWIDLGEGRTELLGRQADEGQVLAYQRYRLVHRRIGRNTDQRSLIACVIPPNRFCADTAQSVRNILPGLLHILIVALFNSFVVDADLRRRITAHLDMHFMYATHIPRLTERDPAFAPIAERAARLICTTPEFDALAREVGLKSHKQGAIDPVERGRLRAELDGLIAHLYGLTEEEFAYILTTFPLVPDPVKVAAHNAYRDVERGLIK